MPSPRNNGFNNGNLSDALLRYDTLPFSMTTHSTCTCTNSLSLRCWTCCTVENDTLDVSKVIQSLLIQYCIHLMYQELEWTTNLTKAQLHCLRIMLSVSALCGCVYSVTWAMNSPRHQRGLPGRLTIQHHDSSSPTLSLLSRECLILSGPTQNLSSNLREFCDFRLCILNLEYSSRFQCLLNLKNEINMPSLLVSDPALK